MKDIHTYRNWNGEGKALNPKLADMELPQLIDLVANAYGRLNAINAEQLDTPTLQRIVLSKHDLRTALRQLDICIDGYKM